MLDIISMIEEAMVRRKHFYIDLGNFIYIKCDMVTDGYILTIKNSKKQTLPGTSIIAVDTFAELENLMLKKFGLKIIPSFKEIAGAVNSGFVGVEAGCRRVSSVMKGPWEKDYVSSWNAA